MTEPTSTDVPVLVIDWNQFRSPLTYWRVQFGRRAQLSPEEASEFAQSRLVRMIELKYDEPRHFFELLPIVVPLRVVQMVRLDETMNAEQVEDARRNGMRQMEKHALGLGLQLTDVSSSTSQDPDFGGTTMRMTGTAR